MSPDDSGNNHNFTEAVGTRLSPRTKRQFDEYKEKQEIGNSEALRRLVRAGLEVERGENKGRRIDVYANALLITSGFGIILGLAGQLTPLQTLLIIGVGLLGIGLEQYNSRADTVISDSQTDRQ